jgi:signal peptidase II
VRALRRRARAEGIVSDDPEPAKEEPASEPAAPAAPTIDRAKWILFSLVGVLSLVADQATKVWARSSLLTNCYRRPIGAPVHSSCKVIDGFWDWQLSENPGSAFSLFGDHPQFARWVLTLVGWAAVGGMIYMVRKARPDQKVLHWALGLVIGGALGNLIDRMRFGVVTDFIHWDFHVIDWPVFNVADVVLVVGVGLMFIDMHKENKRAGKKPKSKKEARADAHERAKAKGLVKDFGKPE